MSRWMAAPRMTRLYQELLSPEPAWPELQASLARASNLIEVLPPSDQQEACLVKLQVTTRSNLGALAHETGGLLVDGGWLRILGSGSPRLPRALGFWNEQLGVPLGDALLVADDVVGGFFAINGGALPGAPGHVHYLAPDTQQWEDLDAGYSPWLSWVCTGDLAQFYGALRWPGWQHEVATLGGDQMFHAWPPLWTREGAPGQPVSRRPVPAREMFMLALQVS